MRSMKIWMYVLAGFALSAAGADPIQQWVFDPAHVEGQTLRAVSGGLDGKITGPFKAESQPDCLSFVGTSKAGNEIILTDDLVQASLPKQDITIEAWVKTASDQQSGPARIVTLSSDTSHRNVTLGQQGKTFEARLRTTATSPNGVPAITTPDVIKAPVELVTNPVR